MKNIGKAKLGVPCALRKGEQNTLAGDNTWPKLYNGTKEIYAKKNSLKKDRRD